jgi:hypothetical protein
MVTHLVVSACGFAPSAALHAALPLRVLRSHTPHYLRRCAPRQGKSRPMPSTVILPPPVSLVASALPCLPRPTFYLLACPRVVPVISQTPVFLSRSAAFSRRFGRSPWRAGDHAPLPSFLVTSSRHLWPIPRTSHMPTRSQPLMSLVAGQFWLSPTAALCAA